MSSTSSPIVGGERSSLPGAAVSWSTGAGTAYQGDALELLPQLASSSFDLVFADPPFNLGKAYGTAVDDNRAEDDYLQWCEAWAQELVRLLAPGGSLFVYNLPRWNIRLAGYFGRYLTFRHWIAVDMKYSLPVPRRLYPAHYSLLYFCKGERPRTFQPPRVPMVTCPHCGMEVKDYGGYKDRLNPAGFNLSDVWTDLSPVRHTKYKSKSRHGNQLPVKMLDRIIKMASQPGDRVLDPFAGSGTTPAVAELKQRKWVAIEIETIQPIIDRLTDLEPDRRALAEAETDQDLLFSDAALVARLHHGHKLRGYRIASEQTARVERLAAQKRRRPRDSSSAS